MPRLHAVYHSYFLEQSGSSCIILQELQTPDQLIPQAFNYSPMYLPRRQLHAMHITCMIHTCNLSMLVFTVDILVLTSNSDFLKAKGHIQGVFQSQRMKLLCFIYIGGHRSSCA